MLEMINPELSRFRNCYIDSSCPATHPYPVLLILKKAIDIRTKNKLFVFYQMPVPAKITAIIMIIIVDFYSFTFISHPYSLFGINKQPAYLIIVPCREIAVTFI